ncbi:MAG: transcriptional regulator [Burkholderiaceae bacterium]|nr:MAG: transcriptional regulator [Burkholderiaceae bacterium]
MGEELKTSLKIHRTIHNLTQAELAERIGVTRKSINAIEMGHMVPSTILALKLARTLNTTVEHLFALTDGE